MDDDDDNDSGFRAEEGRRSRRAKSLASVFRTGSLNRCPAATQCVIRGGQDNLVNMGHKYTTIFPEDCGPGGYVKGDTRNRSHFFGGRGMLMVR